MATLASLVSILKGEIGWPFAALANTPADSHSENAVNGLPAQGTNATTEGFSANNTATPGNLDTYLGSSVDRPEGNHPFGGMGGGQDAGGTASGPLLAAADVMPVTSISDPWSNLDTAASVFGGGTGTQTTSPIDGPTGGHDVLDNALFASASHGPGMNQRLLPLEAHGSGSSHSTPPGNGEIGTETFVSPGSNLTLVVNFDSSTAKAPGGFDQDIATVAQDLVNQFSATNPITVTIDVGYGEVGGSKLSPGVLGESEAYYQTVPGSTASAQYASLAAAFSTQPYPLPQTDPVSGKQQWWVTTAEGKALGLFANSSSVDGYVGFSSASGIYSYDINPATGITVANPGQYDFAGTVAHEFSEVMGRATLNGQKYPGYKLPEYMPLDLFHYSANSVPDFSGTVAGYFSVDGGATDLENFNTDPQGDFSDWQPMPSSSDAFDAFGGLGMSSPVSYTDYLAMQAVGWIGTGWSGSWG